MSIDKEQLRKEMQGMYNSENPDDDLYDELIAEIIKIEKVHKFSSAGEKGKLEQLNRQIKNFIDTDD
jgi:hypothetical protein